MIVMTGYKSGDPIGPVRRFLVKTPGQFFSRVFILMLGIVWIKVERPDIDYTEYLGEQWVKTYEGETEIVVNH